jgi:hypothetical protein
MKVQEAVLHLLRKMATNAGADRMAASTALPAKL